MMPPIKKVYYIKNVFSPERKMTRLDDGQIRLEQSYATTLTPFAMDAENEDFVIFRIDRGEKTGLYVWACLYDDDGWDGKTVRITMANGLALYTKWTDQPMDVSGDFPEEAITTAIQVLKMWPHEAMLAALNEIGAELSKSRNGAIWQEAEREILEAIDTVKKEHKRLLYMY